MINFVPKIKDMLIIQRDLSWDFVKFILMFFIVFGHFCPSGEEWTPVTRVLGLFVIPGFFLVSGYFQSQVKDISGFSRKMQRLFMRIVLPMLSWGIIYVFLSMMQYVFSGEITSANEFFQFIKYTHIYIMGIYWFFTALILCVVSGSIISLFLENNNIIGLSLLMTSFLLCCIVSPTFFEQYHFSFTWQFYVVGMIYRHVADCFSSKNMIMDILFLVLFVVMIVVGVGFEPQYTFYYKSNLIRESSINFVVWRYVLYLAATCSAIYGLKKIYHIFGKNRIFHRFASYGTDTLFIYCSHVLVLVFIYRPFLLSYLYCERGNWIDRINEHVTGLLVSLLIYFLMQKLCLYCKQFRWLRVFFMGTN